MGSWAGSCGVSGMPISPGDECYVVWMSEYIQDWAKRCGYPNEVPTYHANEECWRFAREKEIHNQIFPLCHKSTVLDNPEKNEWWNKRHAYYQTEGPFGWQFGTYDDYGGLNEKPREEIPGPYFFVAKDVWDFAQASVLQFINAEACCSDREEWGNPVNAIFSMAYTLRIEIAFGPPIIGWQYPSNNEWNLRLKYLQMLRKSTLAQKKKDKDERVEFNKQLREWRKQDASAKAK